MKATVPRTFPRVPRPRRADGAFTLVELLASMAILLVLVVTAANLASLANRAWTDGERNVEVSQGGRAVLEMMSRELTQAVVSPQFQFVQGAPLPAEADQRALTDSVFWVTPAGGSLGEVGYYLTNRFQLKRFFVPPDDAANYQILNAAFAPTSGSGADVARWVTDFAGRKNAANRPLSTTVSDGVLGFFARCLDVNGDPVPWLAANVKYNSAACFQGAAPGLRAANLSPPPNQRNPSSFRYTNPATTRAAHLPPGAVELTLVVTDPKTLRRVGGANVPGTPGVTLGPGPPYPDAPLQVPGQIQVFNQRLASGTGPDGTAKVPLRTARTFSTVVSLPTSR